MTVNYATVEGMLEVLDANPQLLEALRARILTRELLELPSVVAELSASQIRMENVLREFMEATNARLCSLENAVVVIQRDVNEMKGDVSVIKGRHVEMDLQGKIHGMLGTMRLRRARVVRATYPAAAQHKFCDKVYDALEVGTITEDQYRRVMDTDLIAGARRRGFDERVYVAVETSNRLDRDDVDRVERTAQALAAVFPQSEILAMVYGVEISDADRLYAESKGVETMLERAY